MGASLAEKRERALSLRVVAVGAFADALRALARLDVLEREAEKLGDLVGEHGLSVLVTPDSIAQDAAALFLDEVNAEPLFEPLALTFPRVVLAAEITR